MEDRDVRTTHTSLGNHRPLASTTTFAESPPLTSPSVETAVGSQQWSRTQLKRERLDSDTPSSPISSYDAEKGVRSHTFPVRSTSFPLPRRESTLTTLDDVDSAVHGYPRLATFMGHEPGAAIYRRFASLNARILLYKQAEIVCLEHELDDLEKTFAHEKHVHYSIKELAHARPGSLGSKFWEKIQQLDQALERYNALLLQQKSLYDLPSANDIDTNDLNNFIHNEHMGGRWLRHPEDTIWETIRQKGSKRYKAEQKDLVRLSGGDRYIDPFTRFLWGSFLEIFHSIWRRLRHPDSPAGAYVYNEKLINRIAKTSGMATASLLPTVSILALYYIDPVLWKMLFIVFFSLVFTAAMAAFTSASRIEVFIGSVSLAGVQAVFVGNLITPNNWVAGGGSSGGGNTTNVGR